MFTNMFTNKTKVLLVLPVDVVDRARAVGGRATMALKLPVSLQIVFRALIEEGLKRGNDPALLENVERQARTVRDIRRAARASVPSQATARRGNGPSRTRRRM